MQLPEVALARTLTAAATPVAFAVTTRYALRLSTDNLSLEAPIYLVAHNNSNYAFYYSFIS